MTASNLGDLWAGLYVPAPPGPPACEGAYPGLFDVDWRAGAVITRAATTGKPMPQHIEAQFDVALRYCAECPLAVREWCVNEATLPRQGRASIIAGGKVFSQGRVIWDLDRQAAAVKARAAA